MEAVDERTISLLSRATTNAHFIGSRAKIDACKNHGLCGYTAHYLSEAMLSCRNGNIPWSDGPLLVEVPPQMNPHFESTLKRMVAPVLAAGHNVMVFTLPDHRRKTHRATWIDQWNRRYGKTVFTFVKRCITTFVPDHTDNRHVYIASNIKLPADADTDSVPSRSTTCHLWALPQGCRTVGPIPAEDVGYTSCRQDDQSP